MGTRNLTCVMLDGEYRIAQYGQWDGDPSGQGMTCLNFLRAMDRAKFVEAVKRCRFVTDQEYEKLWEKCGCPPGDQNPSREVIAAFDKAYPQFSRDNGASVLKTVYESTGEFLLTSQIKFAGNSLMCEWAYVVDLDKNTFEVFKGFNKRKPGKNARFNDVADLHGDYCDDKYYHVRLKTKFSLTDLPDEATFYKKCGVKP
jgi:hypothetical protein